MKNIQRYFQITLFYMKINIYLKYTKKAKND